MGGRAAQACGRRRSGGKLAKLEREDEQFVVGFAKKKISAQFNEMAPALLIFDKHWVTMSELNQKAIWNYLKVLCILCEKARGARSPF